MDFLQINLSKTITKTDIIMLSDRIEKGFVLEPTEDDPQEDLNVLSEALTVRGFQRAAMELKKRHEYFSNHRATERQCKMMGQFGSPSGVCFRLSDGPTNAFVELWDGKSMAYAFSYRGDPVVVAQILLAALEDIAAGWPEVVK